MREQWYVDLDREYVSERFAAARRRIDNLKLDWLDIEAMYTSSAVAEQYHDVRYKDDLPPEFEGLFDKYKKKAQKVHEPCYQVKGAQIFFTYNNYYYQVSPWRLACSGEVFEILSDDLIDAMYTLGAYDMFYAGMVD